MLSPLKVKIISWYTGLLAAILIAVFVLLYFLLGYQMSREVANTTAERLRWTDKALDRDRYYRESEKPIDISGSRVFRHGIREFTDQFDDLCLLAVYRGDQLLYLSKQFEDLRPAMRRFSIPEGTVADIAIAPWVRALTGFYEAAPHVGWDTLKHVPAWLDRFLERPAVQRGLTVPAQG